MDPARSQGHDLQIAGNGSPLHGVPSCPKSPDHGQSLSTVVKSCTQHHKSADDAPGKDPGRKGESDSLELFDANAAIVLIQRTYANLCWLRCARFLLRRLDVRRRLSVAAKQAARP